jgi:hypothetical protein
MWIADEKFLDELSRGQAGIIYESVAPPNPPHYRVLVSSDIHCRSENRSSNAQSRRRQNLADLVLNGRYGLRAKARAVAGILVDPERAHDRIGDVLLDNPRAEAAFL